MLRKLKKSRTLGSEGSTRFAKYLQDHTGLKHWPLLVGQFGYALIYVIVADVVLALLNVRVVLLMVFTIMATVVLGLIFRYFHLSQSFWYYQIVQSDLDYIRGYLGQANWALFTWGRCQKNINRGFMIGEFDLCEYDWFDVDSIGLDVIYKVYMLYDLFDLAGHFVGDIKSIKTDHDNYRDDDQWAGYVTATVEDKAGNLHIQSMNVPIKEEAVNGKH